MIRCASTKKLSTKTVCLVEFPLTGKKKSRNCSLIATAHKLNSLITGGWRKDRKKQWPPGAWYEDNGKKIGRLKIDENRGHIIHGEKCPKQAPKRSTCYYYYYYYLIIEYQKSILS